MLYPQNNRCRVCIDLSGLWEVKKAQNLAQSELTSGFVADAIIGVPGSWNEQLAEVGLMDYVGKIWYQKRFKLPTAMSEDKRIYIHFGSADFKATAWINGKYVEEHTGGFLPFQFDITDLVKTSTENLIIVCVDNQLNHDTIPQGVSNEDYMQFNMMRDQTYPLTVFDFLAYGGLNRSVSLLILPKSHLDSIKINTRLTDSDGIIQFEAKYIQSTDKRRVKVSLWDNQTMLATDTITLEQPLISHEFFIPDCKFWDVLQPNLYKIKFELMENQLLTDEYELEVGVRELKIRNKKLLLNGKPVFLKGFGKHEDFPVLGRGLSYPLIAKDFQLMKWIGANSFRTSHYPYAEEIMYLADRMGFLVINEVPAVSLNFKYVTDRTMLNHKAALSELIERDLNHPSVIIWSIANEPGIWGEKEAVSKKAENYWKDIYNHVKKMDNSRPITLPTCAKWNLKDLAYHYSDIISINRYWGWYEIPAEIEKAGNRLKRELNELYKEYKKPIIVTEFGADTIEGQHATYPQLFTEEYQIRLIEKYFEIIESLPFMVGEHIWNFADFQTAQHFRRVVLNKKGVFNRQRQPKSAAFAIRKHWRNTKNGDLE